MPKDVYYLKHDANASSDPMIKAMRKKYGWEGYGWFWYLVETLRNEDEYIYEYTELTFEVLSDDLRCDPERVKEFIDDCIQWKLFSKNKTHFYSDRLIRDMNAMKAVKDKLSEGGKKTAEKRWGKKNEKQNQEKPEKKATRHRYGEFKNVLLTDEQHAKLVDKFGEELTNKKIEEMSAGIEMKGYKYENFYLAILNWDRRDKEKNGAHREDTEGSRTERLEKSIKRKD